RLEPGVIICVRYFGIRHRGERHWQHYAGTDFQPKPKNPRTGSKRRESKPPRRRGRQGFQKRLCLALLASWRLAHFSNSFAICTALSAEISHQSRMKTTTLDAGGVCVQTHSCL